MQISDEIALAGIIATGLGVIVNGLLTLWIAKFTKESANAAKISAEAAKASYEFTKQMAEQQRKREEKLRLELRKVYKDKVLKQAEEAHSALLMAYSVPINGQTPNFQGMKTAPRSHGFTDEQLAEYFTDEEKEQIRSAWDTFNSFINDYYRVGASVDQQNMAISKASYPIREFHKLMDILKRP